MSTVSRHHSVRAALAVSALALLGATDAAAQVAGGSALEEIVVTARRREENLQSVPIAITAFTQEDLDMRRAVALRDVSSFTPSLNLAQNTSDAFTPFSANLILRGLPGAVTYFAQVPTGGGGQSGGSGTTAIPGHYMDLALLEVDKGPQGTLFGTNAIGGAILLEPHRPTNAFEGSAQLTLGNYNDREFLAILNTPIVADKLMIRLVGNVVSRDGYTKILNSNVTMDGRDHQAWRVGVTFKPTEDIENYFVYDGYHQQTDGASAVLAKLDPAGFSARFFPAITALLAQQQALGPRTVVGRSAPAYSKAKTWGVTDILSWTISDDVTLKNIAALRTRHAVAPIDMDGTQLPILDVGPANDAQLALGWFINERQYTDELQLQGRAFDNNLAWTVGAFVSYTEPAGPTFTESTSLGSTSFNQPKNASRSRAVYAQGTYDLHQLVEGLRFTAGIRYNWDFVSNQTRATNASGACSSGIFADKNCVQATNAKFKAPGWTVGLDYQVMPDMLLYVRSGHAYIAGSTNLAAPTIEFSKINPQKVTDVEVGVKSDISLGDMKARINADMYRTWFDDIAVNKLITFTNAGGQIVTNNATVNAAAASAKGVELEATVIPADVFELRANGSYTLTSFTDYPVATFGRAAPAIVYVPRWQYSLTGTFKLPIDRSLGTVAFTASYTWNAGWYHSADVNPFNRVPSWNRLDLRATWNSIMGSDIDLALFMTNATNKAYVTGAYGLYSQLGFGSWGYAEPRMYGAQLKYSFGPGR